MLLFAFALALAQDAPPPAVDGPVLAEGGIPSGAYAIGPGDSLQVSVYGEPTMSGTFPVDAAGELDFPLLGRLPVAGRTAGETAELLRARLSPDFLLNPNVTVSVSAYRSQPVQVLGAVGKPGVYFLRGPTTVLQILAEAGGVDLEGVHEVRVTHGSSGAPVSLAYDQLLSGALVQPLSGGDIVYVPQSLVSVSGQVGKPGEIAFREGLTLSQCLASVGGALPTAALGRVYIVRGDRRIRVNVRRILGGRAPDVTLESGDRVYVPESAV